MNWLVIIVSVLIAQAAVGIGAIFTTPGVGTWYTTLVKPSWNPPGWVFGPVWTLLFAFMGIAAALVWMRRGSSPLAQQALIAYAVQLALNILWSLIFFGAHAPGAAFAEIVVLAAAILVTLILFWRVVPTAGWLMAPYLTWVLFASYLNYTIWQLNP